MERSGGDCWVAGSDIQLGAAARLSSRDQSLAPAASNDLYRHALELSPIMAWLTDASGEVIEVDPRIPARFGLTRDECSIASIAALTHPDDLPVMNTAWAKAQADMQPFDYDARVRVSDGTYRWQRVRAAAGVISESKQLCWYGTIEDFQERRLAAEAVAWLAHHDELTGLVKRRRMIDDMRVACERLRGTGRRAMLMLLNIDRLKPINERFGNDHGDEFLRQLAARLRDGLPPNALIGRTGGNEFGVYLEELSDPSGNTALALLQRVLEAPVELFGRPYHFSAIIGAAVFPRDAENADALYTSADFALTEAKAGPGLIQQFDGSMRSRHQLRLSAHYVAHEALAQKRVFPHYQPQVDLASGAIVGFEALLRWEHKRHGVQSASSIASAFDDPDLAAALDRCMFDQIAANIRDWRDRGVNFERIAINTSVIRFRTGSVADDLLRRIEEGGITPDLLELEITEDVLIDYAPDLLARDLRKLREAGMTIALDDFGTGFASLIHLKRFTIDVLKIDREFVQNMNHPTNAAIIAALCRLGKRLSIKVVAEGVEGTRQAERLSRAGCTLGQGFLFSPPVPACEVPTLIRSQPLARSTAA